MSEGYKKTLRTKRFQYDDDRDALKRGIRDMIQLMWWQFWALVAITIVAFSGLVGMVAYLLNKG